MSQGPETRFIASIHRHLPPVDERPYRMKNHNTYNGGIADVWYSGMVHDRWIEYKFVRKLPKIIDLTNYKNSYALSALQRQWLNQRMEEGRDVSVILGCEEGGIFFLMGTWEAQHARERVKVISRSDIAVSIYESVMGKKHAPVSRPNRKVLERVV